jgi:hypothetical protein
MKFGSLDISKIYVGSTEITKVYLGSELVWDGGVVGTLVANDSEFASAIAASNEGDTITLATGSTFGSLTVTSAPANLTIRAQTYRGATVTRLVVSGTTGLLIDQCKFVNPNAGNAASITANAIVSITANSSATINDCEIDGDVGSDPIEKRLPGISSIDGSTVVITNNEIHHVYDGIICNNSTATVNGNYVHHFLTDVCTGLLSDWLAFDDNVATWSEGWSGKRLTGMTIDSGTINVGDYISTGSGTNFIGGEIVAIGADYIDLKYNPHEIIGTSGTLVGPTGTISYTGRTSDYDGPHGNFFQPLTNGATRSYELRSIKRNFYYRTNPVMHGQMDIEQSVEGVLIQLNGSSYNWLLGTVEHNVLCGNMPIGITLNGCSPYSGQGIVRHNSILYGPFTGADSATRFRYSASNDLTIENNVAEMFVDQGSNTDVTLSNNAVVARAAYATEFPALPTAEPWDLLSYFYPANSGTVETNLAGAFDPLGNLR